MKNKNLNPTVKINSSKTISNGFFQLKAFNFDQEKFEGGEIKDVTRECLLRKIVTFLHLYDPKKEVFLFVQQVRIGAIASNDHETTVVEPIAGIVDNGELPIAAALREAEEEAHVVEEDIHDLHLIHSGYVSPGCSNEYAYHYFANFDSTKITNFNGGMEDEKEDILVRLVSKKEAHEMVVNGELSLSAALGIFKVS